MTTQQTLPETDLDFEEKGVIKPYLEELWYLRVPAFAAVLSIIFFALIPQTQEIYRVFALNSIWKSLHIIFSFGFMFLLSLSIWYSGRALSIKRIDELKDKYQKYVDKLVDGDLKDKYKEYVQTLDNCLENQKENSYSVASEKVKALLWIPRISAAFPLLALALGLLLTWMTEKLPNLLFGIVITFILLVIFFRLVIVRRNNYSSIDPGGLVNNFFQPVVVSSSILVFSVFVLPLVIDWTAKLLGIGIIIVFSIMYFKMSNEISNNKKILLKKIILLILLGLLVIVTASFYPAAIPSFLGSISIVAIFLSIFVIVTSAIFYWGYHTRLAALTSLISLAVIFSLFNWNDNHRLRELPRNAYILPGTELKLGDKLGQKAHILPGLEESFSTWMNSRKDKDKTSKFRDGKYPVYIVSAQGGGIFAAYHAALTLSRLQDLSPTFARHVFAISGVSGGSLGATVFSSLVKAEESGKSPFSEGCYDGTLPALQKKLLDPKSLEAKAHCLLAQDFLSPLLAAGLFPDFVQRFFPSIPILSETLDRARGIEYAFEHAWVAKDWKNKIPNPLASFYKDPNPLEASYYDHWEPKGEAPALVLNTTVVETGERLLLSPFTFKTSNPKFPVLEEISTVACPVDNKGDHVDKDRNHINFSLSTAALLSARFPIVTPVAWFNRCNDKSDSSKPSRSRLADGGYFENSGFSTARAIGERLQKISPTTIGVPFKVVYLALTDNYFTETDFKGLNEIASPVLAFNNSKEARGRSIVEQAEYDLDGGNGNILSKHQFRQFYLTHAAPTIPVAPASCKLDSQSNKKCNLVDENDVDENDKKSNFNLPLGWYLSAFSHEYIRDRIGDDTLCSSGESNRADNNHCVMKSIKDELSLDSSKG